jgi:phosphate starvation-inducible PhoH-like protein
MEHTIVLNSDEESMKLFGMHDENLKLIRDAFPVRIIVRGNEITLSGESAHVSSLCKLFKELQSISQRGHLLHSSEVKYAIKMIKQNGDVNLTSIFEEAICVSERGKVVRPKTLGQKAYIKAIREHDLVIAIGPAGTGKTYLAVAMAISSLMKKEVGRIILTRPAVEAGERLGFLPGDLQEKIDPYLRPLYDALYDMISVERFQKLLSQRVIEIAPLAFMRGRTLNDSFVILDEAQNTTPEQMKMFLTRLGFDSKAVITGDITQIDLPPNTISGLVQSQEVLSEIPGISFIYLTKSDVVRHPLVQEIVLAYEKFGKK